VGGVVWELDRRVRGRPRVLGWAIVVLGATATAVTALGYLTSGTEPNPWWHPMMIALVVGGFSALLSASILAQRAVVWTVTGDGRLVWRRPLRSGSLDLRAHSRVTVAQVIDKTYMAGGPVSRTSVTKVVVVNAWTTGRKKPTSVKVGAVGPDAERALRDAIKQVRGRTSTGG
jgi:hypothetical protein